MHTKKTGKAAGNLLLTIIYIILILIIAVCTFKVTYKLLDYKASRDTYNDLAEKFSKPAETSSSGPGTISVPAPAQAQQPAPQRKDKPVPDQLGSQEKFPIDIDFESLFDINEDVVGWIYAPDTPINYPVAQAKDNDYYLHTLLNGHYNFGGTIFLDCKCSGTFSYKNSILYGHNMTDGSMFRQIIKYKEQSYYDENPYMYLATPSRNYRVDIFAAFVTKSESEIYSSFFSDVETYGKWLDMLKEKSLITTAMTPTIDSKVLTLSTCSYEFDGARTVVIGVLRPYAYETEEELAAREQQKQAEKTDTEKVTDRK